LSIEAGLRGVVFFQESRFFLEITTWLLKLGFLLKQTTIHYNPAMIHDHNSSSRLRKTGLMRPLLAVAATASALMTSQGAVVYSGAQNVSTTAANPSSDRKAVNVDGQSASEFSLSSNFSKSSRHILDTTSADFDFVSSVDSTSDLMAKLNSSVSVDSGSLFSSAANPNVITRNFNGITFTTTTGNWSTGSTGYFGFRFNPSGSQTLYGWGQLSISANGQTMTLVDYAYDDSGAAILTGATTAVPEPSVSLLGLMGLTSVCFLRSRKSREVAG